MQATESISLDAKYDHLKQRLGELDRVVVAFSAGVDSTLVLKAAVDALGRENVLAVTGDSASVPRAELAHAAELAEQIGVEHVMVATDEFDKAEYLANPEDRCYHCKTTLYEHLGRLATQRGYGGIVNGTNADDLGDYRPGLRAAAESEVFSPLADAGLGKAQVRALSKMLGLATFDKPASPCLSSRVPYGEPITPEKLRMIEEAEKFLRDMGIPECRVRHHETLARIEVPSEFFERLLQPDLAERLHAHFRSLGYDYVTLDLAGFRSGSLNEVIAFGRRQGNRNGGSSAFLDNTEGVR